MCLLNASFGKQFYNATTRFFTPKIDDHGVRRGNTGRILARWRRPVAPHEALAWLGNPVGIPENFGEFPIPDPFFPIPILIPVLIGIVVPAKI